jgi:DNA repair protein RecN (Recombination protein N)
MIRELVLENFILAPRLECGFSQGFSVLTGETGAGKSIIVQAIRLLLGARADSGVVRSGAEKAVVQGVFSLTAEKAGLLDDAGIPCDDSDEMVVRRIISATGRGGRVFVNGTVVTLQELRRLVGGLVTISGQHEYHDLLNRDVQRRWLDVFAGTDGLADSMEGLCRERRRLVREIESLAEEGRRLADEQERYRRDAGKIDSVSPEPDEEDGLEARLSLLRSARELGSLGSEIFNRLYNGRGAVYETVAACRGMVEKMCRYDSSLESRLSEMDSLVYQTEELAWAFRDYVQELPDDLSEYERVEERLYSIRQLKRLFGPSIEDVIAYRENISRKLAMLDGMEIELAEAEKRLRDFDADFIEKALKLSDARQAASEDFAGLVRRELAELKLEKAGFAVSVRRGEEISPSDITATGADDVEFLFCPNPGEPFRPMAAIASGGELSRVMLAVRSVLARKSGAGAVIFDEIDAGIGGEIAGRVGQKLAALARGGQVIAITHFPQIAAAGDAHYRIEKDVVDGRTVSDIVKLDMEGRLEELARMLGGEKEAARQYAGELFGAFFRGT